MIINPSAHTVIPRPGAMSSFAKRRKRFTFSIPGGKLLWPAMAKAVCGGVVFVLLISLWLGSSIDHTEAQISKIETEHEQLMTANILLRAKKARLFSREAVGALAEGQLAIHYPESGQYKKFK